MIKIYLKRNWNSVILDDGIQFYLESNDGDGGFPGSVFVEVYYKLLKISNTLLIEFYANTTTPTPIDLTNHACFNLAGHNADERIYNHQFKIFSDYYLDFRNPGAIPTGKLNSVNATKNDFREYTRLGDRIDFEKPWPEEGFDIYFVSNQQAGKKIMASYILSLSKLDES